MPWIAQRTGQAQRCPGYGAPVLMRSCEWQPEVAADAGHACPSSSRETQRDSWTWVTPWSGLALTGDINFLPYELPAPMPVHDLFLPHRRPHSHAVLEDMMTECHLSKCNPSSLIRQIAIGLAAGALCLLILSYAEPHGSAGRTRGGGGRSGSGQWRRSDVDLPPAESRVPAFFSRVERTAGRRCGRQADPHAGCAGQRRPADRGRRRRAA